MSRLTAASAPRRARRRQREPVRRARGASLLRSFPLSGVRVLVVEDHEDSRDALRQMLEWLGATAWPAGNGAEALTIAARESPDLVLSDLRLPGMDGFALLARLRALPAARPVQVVAVTGCGREDDVKRTRAAGFDGHLVKPIDYDGLVAMVRRVLGLPEA